MPITPLDVVVVVVVQACSNCAIMIQVVVACVVPRQRSVVGSFSFFFVDLPVVHVDCVAK